MPVALPSRNRLLVVCISDVLLCRLLSYISRAADILERFIPRTQAKKPFQARKPQGIKTAAIPPVERASGLPRRRPRRRSSSRYSLTVGLQ
jgi:hypothetical protein